MVFTSTSPQPSRRTWRGQLLSALGALWLLLAGTHAQAEDLRVLAAGAAKHAVEVLAPVFERVTGHRILASYDTVGAQRDRVLLAAPGAVADVVILSDAAIDALRKAGRVIDASWPVGQVVVALAVPAGSAALDLSDEAALRRALLAAPSIGWADPARGATAGTHFQKVVESLGLRETLADRTRVLPFGVEVIQAVAQGRIALGVSQSSEIVQSPGVQLAGALPAPHGLATGYSAVRTSASAAGAAFMNFLAEPQAVQAFRASGFVAPSGR